MKAIKKTFIGITALVMAFSVVSLTACGGDNGTVGSNGEIKGNYVAVTEENSQKFDQAVTAISGSTLVGDVNKEDFSFGFEFSSQFTASAEMGDKVKASGKLGAEYKMVMSKDEKGQPAFTGEGSASVEYSAKLAAGVAGDSAVDESGKYSVKAYNDTENVYATLKQGEGDDATTVNAKVKIDEILDDIFDLLPPIGMASLLPEYSSAYAATVGYEATPSVYEMAKKYKLDLAMDDSDGLKVKVSAGEESVWAIISDAVDNETAMGKIKDAVAIKTCKLECYFALASTGEFVAESTVIDLDVTVDLGAIVPTGDDAAEDMKLTVKLSGSEVLKAYGSAVTLPENIATDRKYIDMTAALKGIIGGIELPL